MIWLLRCGFLVLIVLAIWWKLASPPALGHAGDAAANLMSVLNGRLAGPVTSTPWGGPENGSLILSAPIRGCTTPLTVVNISPSFTAAEALEQLQRPGDRHLFAYLDWISDRSDRWALLWRRVREKVDASLGLSPYVATDTMMFIVEPAGCNVARSIPWRRFWAPR